MFKNCDAKCELYDYGELEMVILGKTFDGNC